MSELGVGTEVAGYRIEGVLGRGGMGVVYRGVDERLGRGAAVKVIAAERAGDAAFRRRFIEESRAAAAIDHPNVLPVYAAGEEDGTLFLVTRLVDGPDLEGLLEHEGAMDIDRALGVAAQVGAALDAAHASGLTHRDVKPANVLVTRESGTGAELCYLTDFGLAQRGDRRTRLTTTGQIVGTLDYIAPEQIEGGSVDGRADLYALAVMLYECLAGEPPFPRDSQPALLYAHLTDPPPQISEKVAAAPPALDAVIARALAKSPEDRYGTCAEFVAAVRAALSGRTAPAATAATTIREQADTVVAAAPAAATGGTSRRRRLALVGGTLAAAAIAVAVLLLAGGGGDEGGGTTAALRLSTEEVSLARAIGDGASRLAESVAVAGPTSDLVAAFKGSAADAGHLSAQVESELGPGDPARGALRRGARDLHASAAGVTGVAAHPASPGAAWQAHEARRSMDGALAEIEHSLDALQAAFVAEGSTEAAESVEESLTQLRGSRAQLAAPFGALVRAL